MEFQRFSQEFQEFQEIRPSPFRTIEDVVLREELIAVLDTENEQLQLFGEKQELPQLLEEIISLFNQEKPLYQRWVQERDGKKRYLSVPKKSLKIFLKEFLVDYIKRVNTQYCCHGGEKLWSTKKSLTTHLPCKSMLSFDFQDAFFQADDSYVFSFFYEQFHELKYESRRDLAGFLAFLCTVHYKGGRGLPQGSPHGMALFNRIFIPLMKN